MNNIEEFNSAVDEDAKPDLTDSTTQDNDQKGTDLDNDQKGTDSGSDDSVEDTEE